MAITQQDYWLKPGESIGAYHTRIAALRAAQAPTPAPIPTPTPQRQVAQPTITPTSAPAYNPQTQMRDPVTGRIFDKPIAPPITPPTITPVSPEVTPTAPIPAPTLPTPTATPTLDTYYTSMVSQVNTSKKALEDTYTKQKEDELERIETYKAERDKLTKLQEDLVSKVNPTKSQFYEQEQRIIQNQLDASETASETLESNFTENQKIVSELDSLLTEGNTLIQQMKGVTGLSAVRNPRINQAIEAVTARTGVLKAVLSARSGRIAEAQRMIANASNAIAASKKDELAYLETLSNFYQTKKEETGEYLIKIDKTERDYMNNRIGLLKSDLAQTEKNAQTIKNMLLDPDKAKILVSAGITLNDTPEQVSVKFANYAYIKEVQDKSNELSKDGYTFLSEGQQAPAGSELRTDTDSKGVVKTWWRKPKTKAVRKAGGEQKREDIQTILYNVGIPTAVSTAKSKLNKSYYDKAIAAGLTPEIVNGLWKNIIAGNTFEEIRQGIRTQGGDPAILDIFVQILQGREKEKGIVNPFK